MCRNDAGEIPIQIHYSRCLYLAILFCYAPKDDLRWKGLGRPVLPAVEPDVPQLQRDLPLHLQVPTEVGDEQIRAAVDVAVPARRRRRPAAGRGLRRRRCGAARPRQASRSRRPQARRPGRPGAG